MELYVGWCVRRGVYIVPATRRSDASVGCLVRLQLLQACPAPEHAEQYCLLTAAFPFKITILHRLWYCSMIPYVRLDTVREYPWGQR